MNKETLQQYRDILREIDQLEQEKASILTALLANKPSDGMPKAQNLISDPVGNAASRRADLQTLIDGKVDALILLRDEIERAIEGLPPRERTLMRLKYYRGWNLDKVAEAMHYSVQHIWRLHGQALKKMRGNESLDCDIMVVANSDEITEPATPSP